MYTLNALESFRGILPAFLQPYHLIVLICLVLFLAVFCWKFLRFLFRIAWTLRVILMVASLATYAGINGCVSKLQSTGSAVVAGVTSKS